ncbi:acetylornithine deacetylase [Salipiger sp. 1_MG-2023]|uniref:acetylornithine deacetylase n=1 Tax=Salipiger sp. 1_MG-2023 TaxID=3062665 RepID=UPI0026E36540|nr:acetylornithine deacetylase [Salipiger sp. 1_MG-2023]MDO6584335.1 acetylornithine deacetylase [Salipiger sp. 1_MG-2023]
MRMLDILDTLIGFPTVSKDSNLALIDWAQGLLATAGFDVVRVPSPCGQKAGLVANRGGSGGTILSAHVDVVPTEGQPWTRDPFALSREGDRFYGRGTTDMKGFVACVLALAEELPANAGPVSIVLSWDEELGCIGIPHMMDAVRALGPQKLCVVGEPTSLKMATGHKGKVAWRGLCSGEAGHSAMAPMYRNALHGACDLVAALRREQAALLQDGAKEDGYDVPCSTLHVGVLRGGTALNIVPDSAEVLFEARHLASDAPADLLARVLDGLSGITVSETFAYPGLAADPDDPALAQLRGLSRGLTKVSYGTEAGFFAPLLPTAVCGPGDMAQGHQPDEFVELEQLTGCLTMLRALV